MIALLLSAVVVLIFANGFFVAAEFALVRARRSTLEELAKGGDRRAALVVKQLDDLSEYLSACQFGITLASLGIGFLGEPAIATLVEPAFGGLSHAVAVPISIAIAYILVHGYKHVRLTLSTHSAGGITENDIALAQAVDGLVAGG